MVQLRHAFVWIGLIAASAGVLTGCVFVDTSYEAAILNSCGEPITVEAIAGRYEAETPSTLLEFQLLALDVPGLHVGPLEIDVGERVRVGELINFDGRPEASWTVAVEGSDELLHSSHEEIEDMVSGEADLAFDWVLEGEDCP